MTLDSHERAKPMRVRPMRISAAYLGERLNLTNIPVEQIVDWAPLVMRAGASGYAALFRYGATVTFGLEPSDEKTFLCTLATRVKNPFEIVETEELHATIDPAHEEGLDQVGNLFLRDAESGRLQVVAEVLAKSTALAHYESEVDRVFHKIEPLTDRLRTGRSSVAGHSRLLAQLGEALATQSRVIGRLAVSEKPDLTWDDPTLDRLYERLSGDFELSERDRVLTRKTEFISGSVGLLIDMAHQRQTLRVEWYIVILILIEIVLLVFDLWVR